MYRKVAAIKAAHEALSKHHDDHITILRWADKSLYDDPEYLKIRTPLNRAHGEYIIVQSIYCWLYVFHRKEYKKYRITARKKYFYDWKVETRNFPTMRVGVHNRYLEADDCISRVEFEWIIAIIKEHIVENQYNKENLTIAIKVIEMKFVEMYWRKYLVNENVDILFMKLEEHWMKQRLDKLIKVLKDDEPDLGQLVHDPKVFRRYSKIIRDLYIYVDRGRLIKSDVDVLVMYLEEVFVDRRKLRSDLSNRMYHNFKFYPSLLVRILNESYTNVTNEKFDKNPFFFRSDQNFARNKNLLEPLKNGRRLKESFQNRGYRHVRYNQLGIYRLVMRMWHKRYPRQDYFFLIPFDIVVYKLALHPIIRKCRHQMFTRSLFRSCTPLTGSTYPRGYKNTKDKVDRIIQVCYEKQDNLEINLKNDQIYIPTSLDVTNFPLIPLDGVYSTQYDLELYLERLTYDSELSKRLPGSNFVKYIRFIYIYQDSTYRIQYDVDLTLKLIHDIYQAGNDELMFYSRSGESPMPIITRRETQRDGDPMYWTTPMYFVW